MARTKTKKKANNIGAWFQLGLVGALISAPNSTIVKLSLNGMDPQLFNVLRFGVVALLMTPFLLRYAHRFTKRSFNDTAKAGIFMAIAVVCYVWAIKLSQASYVSVIVLLTPIVLIVYSVKMTGEKITHRSVAGIALAALGAMTIVLLPIALHQGGTFSFYPVATLLALANCALFPLSVIYYRRANESGVPMPALMGATSWIITIINGMIFLLLGSQDAPISSKAIIGVLYSGIVVSLCARVINIVSYEHIGSVLSGFLWYIEVFLAVLIPVFLLHEHLALNMIIGGVLILSGVAIVENHTSKFGKHRHLFRAH